MKGIGNINKRKKMLIIFLILITSMLVVGITHAKWSSNLGILGKYKTGSFNLAFDEHLSRYSVNIVQNKAITTGSEINSHITFDRNSKTAEIIFRDNLDINSLMGGKYILFTYPITTVDGSINTLKEYEADFDKPYDTVKLETIGMKLFLGEEEYSEIALSSFEIPSLEFNAYSSFKKTEEDEFIGQIYLQLTAESINEINALSLTEQINASSLGYIDGDVPPADIEGKVHVAYKCTIPIEFEQK